jgi:soluble lytic murein transglycosylase
MRVLPPPCSLPNSCTPAKPLPTPCVAITQGFNGRSLGPSLAITASVTNSKRATGLRIAILAILAFPSNLPARTIPAPEADAGPVAEDADIAAARFRLAHANELLGKHFRGSVVADGQAVGTAETNRFVMDTIRKSLPRVWKPQAPRIFRVLVEEANRRQFDPIFLMAVIRSESSFNPTAVGPVKELGLMQIRPATAKWIARQYGLEWKGARSLYNPETNIRIGAAYISHLRDEFDSHGRLYLAAYNMGGGNVRKALGKKIWPKDYAARVMGHYLAMYEELVELAPAAPEAGRVTASQEAGLRSRAEVGPPSPKAESGPRADFPSAGLPADAAPIGS